jgi:hypothetical protein
MINVPAIFEGLVTKVQTELSRPVYFFYGSRKELVNHLTQLSAGTTTGAKKYPLVWFVFPFTKRFSDNNQEYCELPDLMIYICTGTKQNSSTKQRMTDNFIPTLYPIYQELLNQIDLSDKLTWEGGEIPHEVIDWPFWGDPEPKQEVNPLNDMVDAVLIKNLKLIVNLDLCEDVLTGRLIG